MSKIIKNGTVYGGTIIVDASLDTTSTNPVQNRAVKAAVDAKQDILQYTTIPAASASNVGIIIQYIGSTTSTYTNGYFYQCINNSGSYSWEQVNVQPVIDSADDISFDNTNIDTKEITSVQKALQYELGCGVCNASASTALKIVEGITVPTDDSSKIEKLRIRVQFTDTNSAASPILRLSDGTNNINCTIAYFSETGLATPILWWNPNDIVYFTITNINNTYYAIMEPTQGMIEKIVIPVNPDVTPTADGTVWFTTT